MSGFSGIARTIALAATLAIGALAVSGPASAQFGDQHRQRGGQPAARGGGVPAFQQGGAFRGGGQVNRWANGGQSFRAAPVQPRVFNPGVQVNRNIWTGNPRPVVRYRRPAPVYAPPVYVPAPVYAPAYYAGYRTCVIRKKWVHTRHGWRKLPRRVCFRRY